MIVVGLTGSIGMGKSTVAKMFKALMVPVFDADETVHGLMRAGGAAVLAVEKFFPESVRVNENGEKEIDRRMLGRIVFQDEAAKLRLEAVIHPLVRAARAEFLQAAQKAKAPLVILDIPLLFEKGGAADCDYTLVVTAPAEVQKTRVMAREGMTAEKLSAILRAQMPDEDKRARADFVLNTDQPLPELARAVGEMAAVFKKLEKRR
jgi:dephospho-CoA kinase